MNLISETGGSTQRSFSRAEIHIHSYKYTWDHHAEDHWENGLEQERSVARVGRRLMERPGEKKIRSDRRHSQREGIEKETTPESVI